MDVTCQLLACLYMLLEYLRPLLVDLEADNIITVYLVLELQLVDLL